MTTNINLLPWREKLRERNKKQFLALCFFLSLLGLVLNGLYYFVQDRKISQQVSRNYFLQTEIQAANSVIAKKKTLDEQSSALMAQLRTLQTLHNRRLDIANLFNTLPRLLPEGIYLSSIEVNENYVMLQGEAPTNLQISLLIHKIDKQARWKHVYLQEIMSKTDSLSNPQFRITFSIE